MTTLLEFVPSSIFQGKVTFSEPIIDLAKAKQLAQGDAEKIFGWPKDLSPEVVSQNLKCVYLAHWVVSGEGSGQWSALVGNQSKRSGSGVASGSVSNKVIENYAKRYKSEEKFHLLGKRDFKIQETPVNSSNLHVIKPNGFTLDDGRKVVESAVESEVSSDGYGTANKMAGEGSVDNYRLGYVSFRNISFRTWLYPVYVGTYIYKDKEYDVKIDGITGHTTIDKPATFLANLLDNGFAFLYLAIFLVGLVALFTGNLQICLGAFVVLLLILGIMFAGEKIQEIAKSGRRQ